MKPEWHEEGRADIEPHTTGHLVGSGYLFAAGYVWLEATDTLGPEAALELLWLLPRRWGFLGSYPSTPIPHTLVCSLGAPLHSPPLQRAKALLSSRWGRVRGDETCLVY